MSRVYRSIKLRRKEVFLKLLKAEPLFCFAHQLHFEHLTMCSMRNFTITTVIFLFFALFVTNIICSEEKVSCKVVPLKARPIIKADVIFSGTVLELIKKPNVELNFARKRRRRKIGKGILFMIFYLV